ncbi:MAG: SusD/RagB family nutrient-binding outer membrane lipoprotein [Bacteroidales bacterium]
MNKKFINIAASLLVASNFIACSDFEDINKDPNAVTDEKAKAEYFFNNSVIEAQQNPEIAERIFILTWKRASHFERGSGFAIGTDNNDYMKLYLGSSYGVKWLNTANLAITQGQKHLEAGIAGEYTKNIIQMARIWRAYVASELTDGFGPLPVLDAFNGVTPSYDSEEEIYEFILNELKDAVANLDSRIDMTPVRNLDAFYAGDAQKWARYGNSLRARLAMRLSNVKPELAKEHFEDAVKGGLSTLISSSSDMACVAERDGWDVLTGVMSRPWNTQPLSTTINNLAVGLGGQSFVVPDSLESFVKDPKEYIGLRLDKHMALTTNDPVAGYFFDGIPKYIDPRVANMFNVPGYNDGKIYFDNLQLADSAILMDPADANKELMKIRTRYSWNTCVAGLWDQKGGLSANYLNNAYNFPCLSKVYRDSKNKRVFFGPWETYFLLAEAAVYNWNTGGSAKEFYEAGVRASFEYTDNQGFPISNVVEDYLASTDYNRVGTSVNFDHTTEAAPMSISYVDGYTNETGTVTYEYPKNSIYKNGAYNNDQLTKIITQKYLAQMPYLPLEAWSDHRRLGLPFMENQAVEIDYNPMTQVPLTVATSKECRLEFYPKRYRYPADLQTNNLAGYNQALQFLGGSDKTTTNLWWVLK